MQKTNWLALSINAKRSCYNDIQEASMSGCKWLLWESLIRYKQRQFSKANIQCIWYYLSWYYHLLNSKLNCSHGVYILMQQIVDVNFGDWNYIISKLNHYIFEIAIFWCFLTLLWSSSHNIPWFQNDIPVNSLLPMQRIRMNQSVEYVV